MSIQSLLEKRGVKVKDADSVIVRTGKPVGNSLDLSRILALPRRPRPTEAELAEFADVLEQELGKGDVKCECQSRFGLRCCKRLKPIQAWALVELAQVGGLLGPIGVGHGKTLLNLLAPMVVQNCKRAVLLVKPDLRAQLLDVDWHYYGQHWRLPNLVTESTRYPGRPMLHVIAYSQLSGTKSSGLLDAIAPDLIVGDELHAVARRKDVRSTRGRRLKAYLDKHPDTRFAGWSGTLTKRSLCDWAEFSGWALKQGSPVPLDWPTVMEWAEAIDPAPLRAPFGMLAKLGTPTLEAFQQRINDSLGVVTSGDVDGCQASLNIRPRDVQVPTAVAAHLAKIESDWESPAGEVLTDVLEVAAAAQEVSCGFFYRWVFPRKEPTELVDRWLECRRNYNSEVREKLKHSPRQDMDSPALLRDAARRWRDGYHAEGHFFPPGSKRGPLPVWECESLTAWEEVEDQVKPVTEAVWVDDFLVVDAAAWAKEEPGVVWYLHTAFGERLAKLSGLVRYGAGEQASAQIIHEKGNRSIIASIKAHGTGKKLHMFARGLVSNLPSSGDAWEQLLGRLHRDGQQADEVDFYVYRHTQAVRKSIETAKSLAAYIQVTFGAPQKLSSKAHWLF